MGTRNTTWLISGGTNYYLSGGANTQTSYAGSGTPWTAESTTPYELVQNTVAGPIWVPTPPTTQAIYSGGPPFANGRQPLYQSYDTITEQVGVQLKATSKDNAIFLLRQLRQILNTAIYSVPCVLAVTGGTNTGYTEIYSADVQEAPSYIAEQDGVFRATITWTRAPFFGLLSSGENLINAVTIKNTGTGSPDNIEALGTAKGDYLYDQQPLNITLTPASGAFGQVMMAVCASRTYTTSGAGSFSTAGTATYSLTHTLTSCLTIHNLKPRVIVRTSAASANARLRFSITYGGGGIYVSPWVTILSTGGCITDLGTYPVDLVRQRFSGVTAPTAGVNIELGTTGGGAATMTMTYTELLLYSTFFKTVIPSVLAVTNLAPFQVNAFPEQTNAICLPYQVPSVFTRNSTAIDYLYDYRGTLPLYAANSNLYVAWLDGSYAHSTTASATLTVTNAALWPTLRGAT